MPRALYAIIAATLLLIPLSGCGQKGGLYLPEPEQAPAAEPAQ